MTRPLDEARKAAREAATVKAAEILKSCFEFGGARPVRDIVGEILDAYEAALKGAGWVIVPREASEAMLRAAIQAEADHYKPSPGSTYRARSIMEIHKLWSAMIAAASQGEGT